MAQRGPFPKPDPEFNDYLHSAIPYLDENWTRLVPLRAVPPPTSPQSSPAGEGGTAAAAAAIPVDPRRAEMLGLFADWNDTYPKSQNSNTRTSTIIDNKIDLRKQIEELLRGIFNDIPESWLTNADRETLNLPVRKKPTHHNTPIEGFPEFTMKGQGGGDVLIKIRTDHDESKSSKPEGAEIEMRYSILLVDQPRITKVDELAQNIVFTKTIYTHHCGTANVGKMLNAACRWVDISNPQRNGPWSQIQYEVIS